MPASARGPRRAALHEAEPRLVHVDGAPLQLAAVAVQQHQVRLVRLGRAVLELLEPEIGAAQVEAQPLARRGPWSGPTASPAARRAASSAEDPVSAEGVCADGAAGAAAAGGRAGS